MHRISGVILLAAFIISGATHSVVAQQSNIQLPNGSPILLSDFEKRVLQTDGIVIGTPARDVAQAARAAGKGAEFRPHQVYLFQGSLRGASYSYTYNIEQFLNISHRQVSGGSTMRDNTLVVYTSPLSGSIVHAVGRTIDFSPTGFGPELNSIIDPLIARYGTPVLRENGRNSEIFIYWAFSESRPLTLSDIRGPGNEISINLLQLYYSSTFENVCHRATTVGISGFVRAHIALHSNGRVSTINLNVASTRACYEDEERRVKFFEQAFSRQMQEHQNRLNTQRPPQPRL